MDIYNSSNYTCKHLFQLGVNIYRCFAKVKICRDWYEKQKSSKMPSQASFPPPLLMQVLDYFFWLKIFFGNSFLLKNC